MVRDLFILFHLLFTPFSPRHCIFGHVATTHWKPLQYIILRVGALITDPLMPPANPSIPELSAKFREPTTTMIMRSACAAPCLTHLTWWDVLFREALLAKMIGRSVYTVNSQVNVSETLLLLNLFLQEVSFSCLLFFLAFSFCMSRNKYCNRPTMSHRLTLLMAKTGHRATLTYIRSNALSRLD